MLALWDRSALAADAGVPDGPAGFGGFALAFNTRTHDEVLEVLDRARAEPADAGVPDGPAGFGGFALAFNTRTHDEVLEVLDRARAAGGTVTKIATETEWGGFSGYFTDPEGQLWEVAFNPFWSVDETGHTAFGDPAASDPESSAG